MNARDRFRRAGRRVRCRVCVTGRAANSHHVVYEQELARRGLVLWDLRNHMPVCAFCHGMHHQRSKIIPLIFLTDENIEYAFESLGAHAYDYLRQRYAGDDERLETALEKMAWQT